ncbi:hypothetical protein BMS3Abin04_02331 [bacterium BMS3Abin04]|nr:hypothetical protein BMS3Abin04_02331 [bacterium BMS3Abin04]
MYNIGINIDKGGNLYFIDILGGGNYKGTLKVLDKKGNILWTLLDDRILGTPDAAPSFSPDGNTI